MQNELKKLSAKVEPISTKRLTKHWISKYSIFNGAKFFLQVDYKIM